MHYLEELADVARLTAQLQDERIAQAAQAIIDCHRRGGAVYVIGNGGSLTTAEHFALDLVKYAGISRARTLASPEAITAYGNDFSFEDALDEQLRAFGECERDILVAFSFSATSPNIGNALMMPEARGMHLQRILITGNASEARRPQLLFSNISICVPSENIRIVEDVHLAIAHCIAGLVKDGLP